MKELIEDYKRRLATIEGMIAIFKSNGSENDNRKSERFNTKASEYRTFILELKRAIVKTEPVTDDVVWVIYDTLRNTFLDRGDFFQKGLKFAKTFTCEADAEQAKNSYIKIYSQSNRKETTEFLETIPVGLQKILKQQT